MVIYPLAKAGESPKDAHLLEAWDAWGETLTSGS